MGHLLPPLLIALTLAGCDRPSGAELQGSWRVDTSALWRLKPFRDVGPRTHEKLQRAFDALAFRFAEGRMERRLGGARQVLDFTLEPLGEQRYRLLTVDAEGREGAMVAYLSGGRLYLADGETVLPLVPN